MYIKRINIIISWILIVSLITHVCVTGYTFLFHDYNAVLVKGTAHLTATLFSIHVLFSIISLFFFHNGSFISGNVLLNKRVIIQRGTAILMILALHRHMINYKFLDIGNSISVWNKIFIIAVELVFYASLVAHITTSVSPSLMEFGLIDSKNKIKIVDIIVLVVCGILACITFVAVTKYVISYCGYH